MRWLARGVALLATAWLLVPGMSHAAATRFRLPFDDYPVGGACFGWGALNPNFPRCDRPGKHVAEDACAPNGTPVFAVADGRVKLATAIGDCSNDWGWLVVVEHTLADESKVCSIYGHCRPEGGIRAGTAVLLGRHNAGIQNDCLPHIHFGIYLGAFDAPDDIEPAWLLGYLPYGDPCPRYPTRWPGSYVDPVPFVLERMAVTPSTWANVKVRFRR